MAGILSLHAHDETRAGHARPDRRHISGSPPSEYRAVGADELDDFRPEAHALPAVCADGRLAAGEYLSQSTLFVRRRALPAAAFSLLIVCGIATYVLRQGVHILKGSTVDVPPPVFERKFRLNDAFNFAHQDPFRFQCPLPGLRHDVMENLSHATQVDHCCHDYGQLGWPYVYPECGYDNCTSCFKTSSDAELATRPVAGAAGLAYAASVSVYGKPMFDGQKMLGHFSFGLRGHDADACPLIEDWGEWRITEAEDDLVVRVYKSAAHKAMIAAFRGTKFTSIPNWLVDGHIAQRELDLGGNASARVHGGFLEAMEKLLPKFGDFWWQHEHVPDDWTVVFTGHSMGGALAILAATFAEVRHFARKPDAVIVFGAPRVSDGALGEWWAEKGMCQKLIRVNVYNDIVHWLPFSTPWERWDDFLSCVGDMKKCFLEQRSVGAPVDAAEDSAHVSGSPGESAGNAGPEAVGVTGSISGSAGNGGSESVGVTDSPGESAGDGGPEFSTRWQHVCPESEFLVPGATKGINIELDDYSLLGGALSHFADDCRFGYGFGVLNGAIALQDAFCGIGPTICPVFECVTLQDLRGIQCFGLTVDWEASGSGRYWEGRTGREAVISSCHRNCCDDPYCEVWQVLSTTGRCWRGRSDKCNWRTRLADNIVAGGKVK